MQSIPRPTNWTHNSGDAAIERSVDRSLPIADYAKTVRAWLVANASCSGVDEEALICRDCGLDDVALFALEMALSEVVPGFLLPDQFDISDVRLRDLVYYLELAARRR